MDSYRECKRCKGVGTVFRQGFTGESGKVYPDRNDPCGSCHGERTFPVPDWSALLERVTTARGASKGQRRFRASCPKDLPFARDIAGRRAYYVWRITRFHGGADVTMPMMAGLAVHGDPFERELDTFASALARVAFGSDMAGASRWGALLGYVKDIPSGLPASAYESGPVADEHKPECEALELK
jgi:hypothetical protein